MSENPTATEWVAARGEKWRAQLSGMEAMLAPVDPALIRALQLNGPYKIADIGCGGGGTAIDILRQAPAGSVVHGFDISPTLIELARNRVPLDQRSIAFEIVDMATAPAPAEPYDRLASRFGVMFFNDPNAAFRNLLHWLAPGGRLAFAVWGRLEENPWMTSVREVVAAVIDLPQFDSEGPGPFRYAEPGKLLSLLDDAGFGELQTQKAEAKLPIGGGVPAAEAANFALASFAAFGELLTAAGDRALNEARRLLTERFSRYEQQGVVQMNSSVHIVTGTRRG